MVFLLACAVPAPAPTPEAAEVPEVPVAAEQFTLVGRAAHEGFLVPSLPDGTALLGDNCATVNAGIRGHGPPCLAERWRSDRRELTFLVANPAASARWGTAEASPARTTWPSLGRTLAWCLEDPLMLPPARDPGGTRTFSGDGWTLQFSGQNRCHLGGVLSLALDRDRAVWSGLTVEGVAWNDGGRARAQALVTAAVTPR